MSILIFLAVLFVLVLVHELGHFAVAKWTGMRVDEFGIGFPPRLFGVRRGETEYTFNLFPIGGFVKIYGEDGIVTGEQFSSDNRSFVSKSKWAQIAVLVAGVTMNILFAWLLITFAFTTGVQTVVSENEASEQAMLTVTNVLPGSPAHEASLLPGSIVKEVTSGTDTLEKLTPSAFSEFITLHAHEPIVIEYTYSGELRVSELFPKTGIIAESSDQAAIGVALAQIDTVSRPFWRSLIDASLYTVSALRDITVGIGKLLYDAMMFRADFSQVAGPVGIVGLVGEASAFGFTSLLLFTAFISLNLAVINILPFPALDGGRLLFVVIEAIKGSPIPPRYAGTLNAVGFMLLILLMVAVTWNDIMRLG